MNHLAIAGILLTMVMSLIFNCLTENTDMTMFGRALFFIGGVGMIATALVIALVRDFFITSLINKRPLQ